MAMRFLVTETDPITIAFLRNAGAAIILTPIAFIVIRRWPTFSQLVIIAAMGSIFFCGLQVVFATALTYTTSGRAAMTYMTMPFLTLVLSVLFRAESLTIYKVLGIFIATSGVIVALWQSSSTSPSDAWVGDSIVLLGAFITAVFNVWSSRWLRLHEPLVVAVAGVLPGTILLFILAQFLGVPTFEANLSVNGWLAAAYIGLFGAAISYMLWLWALRHTTPTLVAIALPMNPFVALILGSLLLDEPLTPMMMAGFLMVLLGVFITNWYSQVKRV